MLRRLLTRIRHRFPVEPVPDYKNPTSAKHQQFLKHFPAHAGENGWMPTAHNPMHPFTLPPAWQQRYVTILGAGFWLWLMYRWKEDAAHEIFVLFTLDHFFVHGIVRMHVELVPVGVAPLIARG